MSMVLTKIAVARIAYVNGVDLCSIVEGVVGWQVVGYSGRGPRGSPPRHSLYGLSTLPEWLVLLYSGLLLLLLALCLYLWMLV